MDTLDEIDSALDAMQRAAPRERKAASDRLFTVMFRRIQHRAHVMLKDYARVQEETGDLISNVYFRLERAFRDPIVFERLRTHQDCLRLVTFHLRFLLLDTARRVRQSSPLPSSDIRRQTGESETRQREEFVRLRAALEHAGLRIYLTRARE